MLIIDWERRRSFESLKDYPSRSSSCCYTHQLFSLINSNHFSFLNLSEGSFIIVQSTYIHFADGSLLFCRYVIHSFRDQHVGWAQSGIKRWKVCCSVLHRIRFSHQPNFLSLRRQHLKKIVWLLTKSTNWGSFLGGKLFWLYIGWNFCVILEKLSWLYLFCNSTKVFFYVSKKTGPVPPIRHCFPNHQPINKLFLVLFWPQTKRLHISFHLNLCRSFDENHGWKTQGCEAQFGEGGGGRITDPTLNTFLQT